MAAAMLGDRLATRRAALSVTSAGLVSADTPPPDEVIAAMADLGLDLSTHRSRPVTPEVISAAALVLTMTRQQLVDVTVLAPRAWSRCFTLGDLLRRGEVVGPREDGQSLAVWVQRAHAGRSRIGLLSLDPADDVADPMGGRLQVYRRSRDELAGLTDRLAALLAPV